MHNIFIVITPSSSNLKQARTIDIAAVRTNGKIGNTNQKDVIAAFTTKVKTNPKIDFDVNTCYNEREWDNNPDFKTAMHMLKTAMLNENDKYVVVTHTDVT